MKNKRVIFVVAGILVAVAVSAAAYWRWWMYHPGEDAFYTDFNVPLIEGAKPILKEEFGFGFRPKGDAVWVYSVPHDYTAKLYGNCAAIHFETGVYGASGEFDTYIKPFLTPGSPGCYKLVHWGLHGSFAIAQFSGDKLITDYVYL